MDYISFRDLNIFPGGGNREEAFESARKRKIGWHETIEVGAEGLLGAEEKISSRLGRQLSHSRMNMVPLGPPETRFEGWKPNTGWLHSL